MTRLSPCVRVWPARLVGVTTPHLPHNRKFVLAPFPALPVFCSSVCVQYNARKWKNGFSASMYYTERKPKSKKWGRFENEAMNIQCILLSYVAQTIYSFWSKGYIISMHIARLSSKSLATQNYRYFILYSFQLLKSLKQQQTCFSYAVTPLLSVLQTKQLACSLIRTHHFIGFTPNSCDTLAC